jgi:hypothetical protein
MRNLSMLAMLVLISPVRLALAEEQPASPTEPRSPISSFAQIVTNASRSATLAAQHADVAASVLRRVEQLNHSAEIAAGRADAAAEATETLVTSALAGIPQTQTAISNAESSLKSIDKFLKDNIPNLKPTETSLLKSIDDVLNVGLALGLAAIAVGLAQFVLGLSSNSMNEALREYESAKNYSNQEPGAYRRLAAERDLERARSRDFFVAAISAIFLSYTLLGSMAIWNRSLRQSTSHSWRNFGKNIGLNSRSTFSIKRLEQASSWFPYFSSPRERSIFGGRYSKCRSAFTWRNGNAARMSKAAFTDYMHLESSQVTLT